MGIPKVDVDRLRQRIREHLVAFGDAQWKRFDRPESISHSLFRRYVRQERAQLIERGTMEPPQTKLLKDRNDKRRVEAVRKEISSDIAGRTVDLMAEIHKMLQFCEALDAEAATIDKEGKVTVKDAGELREAIKTKSAVLRLAIDGQDKYFGVQRIQTLFRVMGRRIAEADPEVARRIVADLKALDCEYGISLD